MIDAWLEEFVDGWKSHDVPRVLRLFTEGVEYWETPFKQIRAENLSDEWQAILNQRTIDIQADVVARDNSKYIVKWHLVYQTDEGRREWAGLYIIGLAMDGRCDYFYQVGEEKR